MCADDLPLGPAGTNFQSTTSRFARYGRQPHFTGQGTLDAARQPTLQHDGYHVMRKYGCRCHLSHRKTLDEEQGAMLRTSAGQHTCLTAAILQYWDWRCNAPPAASATTSSMATSRQPSSTPARAWFSCPCTSDSVRPQQVAWLLVKVMLTGCLQQPHRSAEVYSHIRPSATGYASRLLINGTAITVLQSQVCSQRVCCVSFSPV